MGIGKWFKGADSKYILVSKIPEYGEKGSHVSELQRALVGKGYGISIDGVFGAQTRKAVMAFQRSFGSAGTGVLGDKTMEKLGLKVAAEESKPASSERKAPPWYTFAKKFSGKKETDPEFNKEMSKKWSLFGMDLGTIATSWAAWCGLAMAVALSGVGLDYQKNGALAKNWSTYALEVNWKRDGIPQGAIVRLNPNGCSSSSGNHVSQAEGDCTPEHLAKPGATIDLYGGNQGNTWKVSTYKVSTVCNVRWPEDKNNPLPGRITKNVKCTSGSDSGESTR